MPLRRKVARWGAETFGTSPAITNVPGVQYTPFLKEGKKTKKLKNHMAACNLLQVLINGEQFVDLFHLRLQLVSLPRSRQTSPEFWDGKITNISSPSPPILELLLVNPQPSVVAAASQDWCHHIEHDHPRFISSATNSWCFLTGRARPFPTVHF